MGRPARGQTVLEFLMTYGWAIMVIVIILAVLFYLGVLNPKGAYANTCLFSPGFSCYTVKVLNGSGRLDLDLGQATGKSILITNVSCSQNGSAPLQPLTNNVIIPSGEHKWIAGGSSGNILNCTDASGGNLSTTLSGDRYKANVCISYQESGIANTRTICGTVAVRLEPGGNVTGADCSPNCGQGSACSAGSQCASGVCVNGTCPPPTNLSSCQTIGTPGAYLLDRNLTRCDTCITITSGGSGSTLDCQGHSITYCPGISGANGIYLNSANGVTVKNCVVKNFPFGITIVSSNSNLMNNTLASNNYGFYLANSNSNVFTSNNATGNTQSDFTCTTGDLNIDGGGNTCGIEYCPWLTSCPPLPPSCPGTITSCCTIDSPGSYTVSQNMSASGTCIAITSGGSGSTLDCKGHTITGPSGYNYYGIRLTGASGVTVKNCTVKTFGSGIMLSSSSSNNLTSNTANSNTMYGIRLYQSRNNIIASNTANSNGNYGIYLQSSSNYNNFTGNIASSNYYYGFYLQSSASNNFTSNSATSFYCATGENIDGGSNTCFNVNCAWLHC